MKVLLTQTMDKLGIVGEVVDVSEGFARNYLLPKKLGIQPTDGNIKQLEEAKIAYEKKLKDVRAGREALLTALTGVEITLIRQANEEGHLFGSVSRRDIAEELQKAGHNVTPEEVKLEEPIRRVDTFQVPVQLAGDLKTDIKVWVTRDKAAVDEAKAASAAAEGAEGEQETEAASEAASAQEQA